MTALSCDHQVTLSFPVREGELFFEPKLFEVLISADNDWGRLELLFDTLKRVDFQAYFSQDIPGLH